MTLSIQIAKFKICQYQVRAVLPNLMLSKLTSCTVHSHMFSQSAVLAVLVAVGWALVE